MGNVIVSTSRVRFADRFDPRRNSLNALRLILAASVIVSHSWALGGYGEEPSLGGANLGTWAVIGFFALSGFLITRSRLSPKPARSFYLARFLRIYPAFFVCLLVVAFAFAPFSVVVGDGQYEVGSAISFVLHNLPLYFPLTAQTGIDATLATVPYPGNWDGPLWTLFWEATCYVVVGVLVSVLPRRALTPVLVVAFGALTVVALVAGAGVLSVHPLVDRALPLALAFAAGAITSVWRGLRLGWATVLVAVAVLAIAVLTGTVAQLAALPAALVLLKLGEVLPLSNVGARNDFSYGVYIYGWPVQQTIAIAGGDGLPVGVFICLSLAFTVPFAVASWWLIEKPAMKLKNRLQARPTPASAEAV